MPSSLTPGSSTSHVSSCAMPTRPSPRSERLGTPNTPAIRFTRGTSFEASLVRICYGLSGCSPPWTDLTEFPRPPGAFTSRLPTGRSPVPPLDMTTTATGLLCWRDFHPQEWQLASSGRIEARTGLRMMPTFPRSPRSFRTAGFPQYGWKAGLSGGAFPDRQRLKPAPGMRLLTAGLPSPFVHLRVGAVVPYCAGPLT